jgi:hypothetical protein
MGSDFMRGRPRSAVYPSSRSMIPATKLFAVNFNSLPILPVDYMRERITWLCTSDKPSNYDRCPACQLLETTS